MHQCTAMYGAVKPIYTAYNDAFSSHAREHTYIAICPCVCEENANLLKAGNRALESVGFMTQRAPRRPLPSCPPATTPMSSFHCPPAPFPTTTLYYVTSLDHRHLICRQLLPAVVLNVALIALPLIMLGETPFVDVAHSI